jgi:putative adhesin
MRTFETPEPITVSVELRVGDVRIVAGERADTTVDVRPSDPDKEADVKAAAQTRVELVGGRLAVHAPKGWWQWMPWGGHESVDVQIEVPAGSRVLGEGGMAALRVTGPLDECQFRAGVGDIRLERAGSVRLKTGAGDVAIDEVGGAAEITTGSGAVDVARVGATAVVKNGNGNVWIGEVAGEARVHAGNGGIAIDRAHAGIAAKTANGSIRLGEVERGAVVAQTAVGAIDVGVRDGVPAWLDLDTKFGSVQNDLGSGDRPASGADTVAVHARTSMGDITVRRSDAPATGKDGS